MPASSDVCERDIVVNTATGYATLARCLQLRVARDGAVRRAYSLQGSADPERCITERLLSEDVALTSAPRRLSCRRLKLDSSTVRARLAAPAAPMPHESSSSVSSALVAFRASASMTAPSSPTSQPANTASL